MALTIDLEAYLRSPLGKFSPWVAGGRSPQRDFVRAAATHRARLFRAGNRCGKTTVGCVDTLLHLLGWHPFSIHRPPVRWWVSGLDWEFGVGQVLWPTMRELMPWDQVRGISYARRSEPELPNTITFRNGSQLTFKSGDSGRRKYQGAKLHGIWFDEEHPADVVEEGRARLLDTGGYFTATLTPVMRARWVLALEREKGTHVSTASLFDAAEAGLVDRTAAQQYADGLPERQRAVRVEGRYVALEGAVYPDFNRGTHVASPQGDALVCDGKVIAPWPLPKTWPRRAAIDFGYANPCAVVVGATDPRNGRLLVERCYYASWIRASVWAEHLRRVLPPLVLPPVADHQANERAELAGKGVVTRPANKDDVVRGLEAVERRLVRTLPDGAPALVLVADRKNDPHLGRCDADKLAWELESYHYPPQGDADRTDVRDLPVKKDDHACDALRYLVVDVDRGGPRLPPGYTARAGQAVTDEPEEDTWRS